MIESHSEAEILKGCYMMDYKELISQLKALERQTGFCVLAVAADAVETLLVERDALMKDAIRCGTCLHAKECYFNELRRIDCAQSNRGHWEWRGPQKEGSKNA